MRHALCSRGAGSKREHAAQRPACTLQETETVRLRCDPTARQLRAHVNRLIAPYRSCRSCTPLLLSSRAPPSTSLMSFDENYREELRESCCWSLKMPMIRRACSRRSHAQKHKRQPSHVRRQACANSLCCFDVDTAPHFASSNRAQHSCIDMHSSRLLTSRSNFLSTGHGWEQSTYSCIPSNARKQL